MCGCMGVSVCVCVSELFAWLFLSDRLFCSGTFDEWRAPLFSLRRKLNSRHNFLREQKLWAFREKQAKCVLLQIWPRSALHKIVSNFSGMLHPECKQQQKHWARHGLHNKEKRLFQKRPKALLITFQSQQSYTTPMFRRHTHTHTNTPGKNTHRTLSEGVFSWCIIGYVLSGRVTFLCDLRS